MARAWLRSSGGNSWLSTAGPFAAWQELMPDPFLDVSELDGSPGQLCSHLNLWLPCE